MSTLQQEIPLFSPSYEALPEKMQKELTEHDLWVEECERQKRTRIVKHEEGTTTSPEI